MKKFKIVVLTMMIAMAFGATARAQVSALDSNAAQFSILSAGTQAAQISRLREVPRVGVINLAFGRNRLEGGSGTSTPEFRISAQKNARGINMLRRAFSLNPVARKAMAERGVAISSIVGVDIGSDGSLRVFKLR